MAVSLQSHVVSDLCLGKPALKCLSIFASVADALVALRESDDSFISIWTCDHRHSRHHNTIDKSASIIKRSGGEGEFECKCVGEVCMGDILCFLCKDENLASPISALQSPLSLILPKTSGVVNHVDPSTSLIEAIGLILQGAHHLVVPIQATRNRRQQKPFPSAAHDGGATTSHGSQKYCWLTQEDLVRFILSRIGLFNPIPSCSLEDLAIIRTDTLAMDYHSSASLAVDLLARSLSTQTSLAVTNELDGALVGEISPAALAAADETAAAAVMTLSCGDFVAYIDSWGGPPEDLINVVKARLKEMKLEGLLALFDDDYSSGTPLSSSSSDDDDSISSSSSSSSTLGQSRRHNRSGSYSIKLGRRVEEITCHPGSSLVAVMIQAIAHRVNYVWVVEEDCSLAGIVTITDMLKVFYEYLQSSSPCFNRN